MRRLKRYPKQLYCISGPTRRFFTGTRYGGAIIEEELICDGCACSEARGTCGLWMIYCGGEYFVFPTLSKNSQWANFVACLSTSSYLRLKKWVLNAKYGLIMVHHLGAVCSSAIRMLVWSLNCWLGGRRMFCCLKLKFWNCNFSFVTMTVG